MRECVNETTGPKSRKQSMGLRHRKYIRHQETGFSCPLKQKMWNCSVTMDVPLNFISYKICTYCPFVVWV